MADESVPVPIRVQAGVLDAAALRAAASDPSAGAVVVFEGTARDHHEGLAVADLAYEAFVPMAEAELGRLRTEALERFGLCRCLIHHRIGVVPLLEAAVVIVTASPHRQEAFAAAAWLMDEIKHRVPIWKRERYAGGGESWVEGQARRALDPRPGP
ncbi:MAG: molybdenum cofactor biosynthesis protein MoaE [Holophagaceae bacterium]|nr:molybdenum cofactor biosynthesis protein MoaE [Holophagaceae bacterium]